VKEICVAILVSVGAVARLFESWVDARAIRSLRRGSDASDGELAAALAKVRSRPRWPVTLWRPGDETRPDRELPP
jgi:hypothetical protein